MKVEEGPLFSAVIIGAGIGYLVFRRTGNILVTVGAALGAGLIDYFLLKWINLLRKKK